MKDEKTFIQVARDAISEMMKRHKKNKYLEFLLVAVDYGTDGGNVYALNSHHKEKGLIPNLVIRLMREDRGMHNDLVETLLRCLSDNDLLSLIEKCSHELHCRVGMKAKLKSFGDEYIK